MSEILVAVAIVVGIIIFCRFWKVCLPILFFTGIVWFVYLIVIHWQTILEIITAIIKVIVFFIFLIFIGIVDGITHRKDKNQPPPSPPQE